MRKIMNSLFGFFCLLFLVGLIGLIWQYSQQPDMGFRFEQVREERAITMPFTAIELETDTADVVLSISKTSQASAKMVGEVSSSRKGKQEFITEVTPDGTLHVSLKEQQLNYVGIKLPFNSDFGMGKLELQLTLPELVYEQVVARSGTGDIRAGRLKAKQARLQSSTGDVELEGFEGDVLEVKTDTGDMDLPAVTAKVQLVSSTGDVKRLQLNAFTNDADIHTDTGDVHVTIRPLPDSAQLDLASDVGDVEADWPRLDYTEKGRHRLIGSVGSEGPKLTVRSSTGDIRIQQ
ncbi:DUF4097 family beta strand repeat protein [Brevibacillus composti]|uniref:DUF4097 family beta strand repeat protein n=1 Tax=Brevibacillus composti TaxID=2796470 RepID=A0A7T5EIS3_9BACL|nr:DUF4097 family beta strand repeat-containing protein [Brevibacillus composti]QQE73313.1 DUF4097 family beta strand repeat protein [Brevibacillus composti]QUO40394.1 DUF4097 family beta strand repeat protein [Brevibacillus composti]